MYENKKIASPARPELREARARRSSNIIRAGFNNLMLPTIYDIYSK